MSIFTLTSDTPVNDEKLRRVIHTTYQIVRLSAEKAALHLDDPKRYPLDPQARCFEKIFLGYFQQSPAARQKARASADGVAAPERARMLGPLSGVDFRSPVPVSEQVSGAQGAKSMLPDLAMIPPDAFDWPRRGSGGIDRFPLPKDTNGNGGGKKPPLKRLVLRGHRVKCVKETGEWGKDEIDLAATAVNITTNNNRPQFSREVHMTPFRVGSFHTGKEVSLNDKILYPFYPPADDKYPAIWVVALLLVERDKGDDKTIMERLAELQGQLYVEVQKATNRYYASALTDEDSIGNDLLTIIIIYVFGQIQSWLADEFFDAPFIGLSIDAPTSRLLDEGNVTPRQTVTALRKKGKDGKYEITTSWAVVV